MRPMPKGAGPSASEPSRLCLFELDDKEAMVRDHAEPALYFDSNGVLAERRWLGGQEVIVHYDDIPRAT